MKRKHKQILLIIAGILLLFVVGTAVLAQTSAGFNLTWHVIGSGGGQSTSASYKVNGTIGQSLPSLPNVNTHSSSNFSLQSGYWSAHSGTAVYLPIIVKH